MTLGGQPYEAGMAYDAELAYRRERIRRDYRTTPQAVRAARHDRLRGLGRRVLGGGA